MEQIFISKEILDIRDDYFTNLFSNRAPNFKKPKSRLKSLCDGIWSNYKNNRNLAIPWAKYFKYVKNIIRHYDDIICLKPSEFDSYYNRYFSNLSEGELTAVLLPGQNKFYERVVDAMRYDAVRDQEYAPYIRALGIKSCVYCNAQYSLPTHGKGNNNEDVRTYEIDHYYPKSKYPFLCTTFFNLVPSCGPCNRRKNDSKVNFCLYTEIPNVPRLFKFSLDKTSVINYILTHNNENIKYSINSSNQNLLYESQRIFHLEDIYTEHKDIAEELIWKHWIYNKSNRIAFLAQFNSMFNFGDKELYRLINGTYAAPDSIHKRPLTLFIRDIIEDLDSMFDIDY